MSKGRFGAHGGQYIPETLMNAVLELEEAYNHYKNDPEFQKELTTLLNEYAGRPSRLYYAEHMTKDLGGAKIYLKREDLNHTGAHKDQQRARSDTSREEDGKDPCHRRDRRRPARRSDSDGGSALRHGMRDLHGRGGHKTSGIKCLQNAPSRSKGACGDNRNRNPQRCCFGGNERVDEPDRGHPLCSRLLYGTTSVPDYRP